MNFDKSPMGCAKPACGRAGNRVLQILSVLVLSLVFVNLSLSLALFLHLHKPTSKNLCKLIRVLICLEAYVRSVLTIGKKHTNPFRT